jgi:polyisoprenoid-binding protein YceI
MAMFDVQPKSNRGTVDRRNEVLMIDAKRGRFEVNSGRSAVLIEARSTVGPITFGTTSVGGFLDVGLRDGEIDLENSAPTAKLELELKTLSSGNSLYDAELLQRVDARRFPMTVVELRTVERIGRSDRYTVEGDLTFHGVTRRTSGTVEVRMDEHGVLHAVGEHVFDIRDFEVEAPTVLMLRIYPDVRLELQLEAVPTV